MYKDNKILVVIPARGGSKGIPRKNIRMMNDKPLIAHTINHANSSEYIDNVVVSTDDDEIKFIAEKFGADVIKRSKELAEDNVPLDPVIYDATIKQEEKFNTVYDFVITLQPTSPLLKTSTLNKAIEKLCEGNDTVISVVDDRHLSWGYDTEDDKFYPLYSKRVNRQYLPKQYRETGSIFATKREFLKEDSRLGEKIDLIPVSPHESIDIDNYEDWWVAERLLMKKRILIKTDASHEIGTGHIYRGLAIASKLVNHDVMFLLNENKEIGINIIKNYNYPYITHKEDNILGKIKEYEPDIVVNDILNTSSSYIKSLKDEDYFVLNFEDLGGGVKYADVVCDALYEHKIPLKNLYSGHLYYILKDEFYYQPYKEIHPSVKEILLTFGGTDPNDLTKKTLNSILKSDFKGNVKVILGLGYMDKKGIEKEFQDYSNIEIFEDVKNISEYMISADIIFTSAGRTMYEIASIGVPCVCLCQNQRELTHIFGNVENGFINLGLGSEVKETDLIKTINDIIYNYDLRLEMSNRMKNVDVRHGFENLMKIVKPKYLEFEKEKKGEMLNNEHIQ
ncbi:MAG: glycosyltransferase [Methanobacteriaceae archaeon]|jgi:CMP-N-acetylneuraminic acid synthetase|uniref:cytidylyltransferase domain-containing protein n=1 Tax=unclassified Methanobrevibacter TaxID=2638681 RepID=UPI00375A8FED|nr:glycosyltransferase [Methanobacteriaceae archaeon]